MLEPHARTLLFDILRPPDGHSLDFGVATTYSLDLLALLTAPVAFSLFEADDHRELLKQNSLTLLESLRRYADRLTVFTQAGLISLPKAQFPQFEFLEKVVIECQSRTPSARFHPKVWLLRFVGPEDTVRYRFACLSRNLTFDRCWDTVLTLEGTLTDRRNGIALNHPLADFMASLPTLSVRPVESTVQERIDRVQSEVRRVAFELPEGFEEYRFHPLGLNERRPLPFDAVPGRMLAISPFASAEGLKRLFQNRDGSLLVSREESLADRNCRAPEIGRYYVMLDVVGAEESADMEEELPTARGLHAKCYVAEAGWKAHIWTGSANATSAGFNGNVEFLVELVGSKSKFGIDSLFENANGKTSFGDMLEEFTEPDATEEDDAEQRAFVAAVDEVRRRLVGRLDVVVSAYDTGYLLTVSSPHNIDLPEGVSIDCWPVTLGFGHSKPLLAGAVSYVFPVAFESITSFIAFRVTRQKTGGTLEDTFVLNLPLTGAPADRRERLLRTFIHDRERFVRYLLLLLANEGFELAEQMATSEAHTSNGAGQGADGCGGLLESFLRTLDREPERLDHVARLVEDLRNQPDATQILPERFEEVWKPIWSARERRRRA